MAEEAKAPPTTPARTGRELQRYREDGKRLVAGGLAIRDTGAALPEVLLITSRKTDAWVFPKGGWETDETEAEAAAREVLEEGGVVATPTEKVGDFLITSSKGNVSAWGIWLMRCTEVRKSWAEEDERSREFVGWNEAKARVKVDLRDILVQAERFFNPPA
eukprot:Rhum_TRINITY_DN6926_c0_g2::Rhum_TRINITY_DN6926_c0_g2_i1::g.21276::m.21276/K07766/E3.6.1.52; diphosphoinositol-polyphosphate diphosphatase